MMADPLVKHPDIKNSRLNWDPLPIVSVAATLADSLAEVVNTFWQHTPKAVLFSVADSPHYFWHTNDFYVAQRGLDTEGKRWAQLRISESMCCTLFEQVLGTLPNAPPFTLATIRPFEVFLL
jgi:hypothetical protein